MKDLRRLPASINVKVWVNPTKHALLLMEAINKLLHTIDELIEDEDPEKGIKKMQELLQPRLVLELGVGVGTAVPNENGEITSISDSDIKVSAVPNLILATLQKVKEHVLSMPSMTLYAAFPECIDIEFAEFNDEESEEPKTNINIKENSIWDV